MLQKIIILGIFFAVTLAVGLFCRKQVDSVGGFVLGSRSAGPWISAFAYGTSYFSSVVFVGYAGQFGFIHGLSSTWIGIANAVVGSFMAWKILGRRTRSMTLHLDCATMPDFFAKRFDNQGLKTASALLIFVFLIPYSASVYKGLSGLFAMAFNVSFLWCVLGIAVLTGIYVVAGGYMAAALNDLLQGIVMLGGIAAVVWAVLKGQGGFTAATASMAAISGKLTSTFGPNPRGLLAVVILTSLGTWGLPQMVHKFYTIKDDSSVKAATVISTLFALVVAGGSYFMGAFGRLYIPAGTTPVFDDIVPTMLAQCLPNILVGVVLVVVLSASMSTLSSLVITSSSTVALDLIQPFLPNVMKGHRRGILVIRTLCVAFITLSVVLALVPNSVISSLMGISWGALAGCFLGPFICGLFSKRATVAGVWATFVSGIGITGANMLFNFTDPIEAGAIAVVASLVVMPIVSAFTLAPNPSVVANAFSCIAPKSPHSTTVPVQEPAAVL